MEVGRQRSDQEREDIEAISRTVNAGGLGQSGRQVWLLLAKWGRRDEEEMYERIGEKKSEFSGVSDEPKIWEQ